LGEGGAVSTIILGATLINRNFVSKKVILAFFGGDGCGQPNVSRSVLCQSDGARRTKTRTEANSFWLKNALF
jgi:hypothetical protein